MDSFIAKLAAFAVISTATSGAAEAACVTPAPASPAAIETFKANPQALLIRLPEGGVALVSEIRNLVTSDRSVAPAIAGLTKSSTPGQASNIGTGLAQAATICLSREPQTAQFIQSTVLATDSPALILAFQAAAGDVRTTAVGGAGGGGALGGSGIGSNSVYGGGGASGGFTRHSSTSTFAGSAFAFSSSPGIAPTMQNRISLRSVSP